VRSYGVKAQKSLAEIAADTGLSNSNCEMALEKLIDLRLVRHLDALYEIAHDFLAREVAVKLIDSEEREFKRVRELLASKAASYRTTHLLLSVEELLLMFKHRQRILLSDEELGLAWQHRRR
jgi:DNA-binding Lrp family transcriptional regulator